MKYFVCAQTMEVLDLHIYIIRVGSRILRGANNFAKFPTIRHKSEKLWLVGGGAFRKHPRDPPEVITLIKIDDKKMNLSIEL